MTSWVLREGLLSLTGVLQRLFSALTGRCCLIAVFFLFPNVVSFVLLRINDQNKKPDGNHLRHPAFGFKILFLLSSLRNPLVTV